MKKECRPTETAEALQELSKKIDLQHELLKMLIVSNVLHKTDMLFEGTGMIVYDTLSDEIESKLAENYHLEQYLICGKTSVFMSPKGKLKMREMTDDYEWITEQMQMCCVLVFEDMSGYERRRCKELSLNYIDLQQHVISIKY